MAELVPDIHWSSRTGTLIVGHDDDNDAGNFLKTHLSSCKSATINPLLNGDPALIEKCHLIMDVF